MGREATLNRALPSLQRMLRRFWPQARGQWRLIALASGGMFAEVLLRLAEPWPLKFVFDRIAGGGGRPRLRIESLESLPPATLLLVCALAVVALAALRAGAAYLSTVGFALAGNRILTRCRRDLFAHLMRLSLSYHSRAGRGDITSRLVSDVGRLQDVAVTAALPLASHLLTLAGMLAVMLFMNPRLGLIALAVVPLFALAGKRLGVRIRQVSRKQRQREGDMASTAAETISAVRVVQAYGLESIRDEAFARQNTSSLRESVKGARLAAALERSTDIAIALGTAAVLWYGATLASRGEISPGDLVVFLAYLKNAFKPLRDSAKFTGRLAKAAASAERILEVLDTKPEIVDRPGAAEAPGRIERVALESVAFSYPGGQTAIMDLSLEAAPGQRIALVGPSGAGKSTILALLTRLYDPTVGRITLNGIDLRDLTVASLRGRVAIVLQESVLFAVSVRENIRYGRPEATDDQIVAAAVAAGADEFIRALPEGYDTVLGERGETLSGGQRQRIALARAAVRSAPILVLDEPTTGLDNRSRRLVLEALDRLAEGKICFVISHDLSAAESADQILYMEHGRVLERGSHAELLALGGRYAALHALQATLGGEETHAAAR